MIPNVLSIAGSDPSGGAGIQADLKTFAALGCHGMAAITALTAQNTLGVSTIHVLPPGFVAEQIRMVFVDINVAAVKIGMLGSGALVTAVADELAAHPDVPVVLDPVLVATSGATLGDDAVIAAMRVRLFPIAALITPNLMEAARLSGINQSNTRADIEAVARALQGGSQSKWLIKGGHSDGETADDYLLSARGSRWYASPRIATSNTHGTGCTLSSAVAAFLAQGYDLFDAVAHAKAYLDEALVGADLLSVGKGPGPVDHFARWRR